MCGEGAPGVRRGAGTLPVGAPRAQPGAGVRDRVGPEPHQVRAAPVAAGHALQPPAAGPCLSLHPGESRAGPGGGWRGDPPPGGLGQAGPLTECLGALFHCLSPGPSHTLFLLSPSHPPVSEECRHSRWGPVMALRPIRVLPFSPRPQAAHGGHALD